MAMTRGFSPYDWEWKESIERSVGQKRGADLEAETIRRIEELIKQECSELEQTVDSWQSVW